MADEHPSPGPPSNPVRHAVRRVGLALLSLSLAAGPGRAIQLAEFSTGCANGDTSISFIELKANENEPLALNIGLRALDHAGQPRFDIPTIFAGKTGWYWISGRRYLLATAATRDRFGYPGEPLGTFPNTLMPRPLDPAGGSLLLYRVVSGVESIIDRVDYGTAALPAPPPGTSMHRPGATWRFEPDPTITYYYALPSTPGRTDDCFGYRSFHVSQLALACESGEPRGQYLVIRANGPRPTLDSRLHLRVFDRSGALLADVSDPFGARRDEVPRAPGDWLLGGPSFAPPDSALADGTLPVALDPVGGRIECSADLFGTPIVFDSFRYGVANVPPPPPGFAYYRARNGLPLTALPDPRNMAGARAKPPDCAAGEQRGTLYVTELALACANGSSSGQFVEIGATGPGAWLDSRDRLVAYGGDGAVRFEMPGVFAALSGRILDRDSHVLFVANDFPQRGDADGVLADTLDRFAGRVAILRALDDGRDTVLAALEWGGPPALTPPIGTSLSNNGSSATISEFPSPTAASGATLSVLGCHLRGGARALQVEEIGLECADGSRDALFLELGALDPLLVSDPTLGLRLATADGAPMPSVFPLFPYRENWGLTGAERWLVAAPGFEARSGLAPDIVLPSVPGRNPSSVMLFRRHPVTGVETVLSVHPVRLDLATPGSTLTRTPAGDYERAALPSPQRFDGRTAGAAGCLTLPHSETVRIHSLQLACRDGDAAGQYVTLEATSPLTLCSPGLVLRLVDRDGRSLGEAPMPFASGYAGRLWPADRLALVGAPGFASLTGAAPDAILPAALDPVSGRVELLLRAADGAEVLLDAIAYGSQAVAAPPPGASLARSTSGLVLDPLPAPSGFVASLAAPTACLGQCPGRTVRFTLGGVQPIAGLRATLTDTGAEVRYDTPAGEFHLGSTFRDLLVHWTDDFRVVGLGPGSPVPVTVSLKTLLAKATGCYRGTCLSSVASAALHADGTGDSTTAALDPRRSLRLPMQVVAGEPFEVTLQLRANAQPVPELHASAIARIEFEGLPPGARVVSCHGFDSYAQRATGDPVIQARAREVTVRWPVFGSEEFTVQVERREAGGAWQPLEDRPAIPGSELLVIDRRVEAGRTYEYRPSWSDEFGSYSGAVARVQTPDATGFAFGGVQPNPSHGVFAARLTLPEASPVRFEVVDVAGRVVASHAGWLEEGSHLVPLARENALAPGVYVVRLQYRGLRFRSTAVVLR